MSTTRTHFTFRVDTWTPDGESIVEHVAGIEDYQVALRYLPRRLPTLARHPHHPAAGRASNRGQQALARGVESIKGTTFREAKKAPALPGLQSLLIGESKGSPPRRSDSIPKHKSHNGCPKNAGRCPKHDIRAGRPWWRLAISKTLTDRPRPKIVR